MPSFTNLRGETFDYATEQEVLDFANEVRKAGGGEVISELFPSTTGNPSQCLIAKALNFNCRIYPVGFLNFESNSPDRRWIMYVDPEKVDVEAIVANTDCTIAFREATEAGLVLPRLIGNTATAFDHSDATQDSWVDKYREPTGIEATG